MSVTIETIKQKILEQAMRGELVEQDPNDEPVEMLLEQIEEEKERLKKEGKLKKQKSLPPIEEDEIPYELPEGWKWVRLNALSDSCDIPFADGPFGSNLKREHYVDSPEVRIIQLSNIGEDGWRDENKKYTSFAHLQTIKRSQVYSGDIVIAKMMPAGRAIEVPEKEEAYVLSSDAVKFVPHTKLNKKYLLFALNSSVVQEQIYAEVQGTTRVRTSLTKLKKYLIPLPPLQEQQRIVEKAVSLFNLCNKWEEEVTKQQNHLSVLRNKVLDDAMRGLLVEQDESDEPAEKLLEKVEEEREQLIKEKKIKKQKALPSIEEDEIPYELPNGWKWVRLGEYTHINMGQSPPSNSYNDNKDGLPFYQGKADFGLHYPTPRKWCDAPKKIANPMDILISVRAPVGQTNICQEESCIGRGLAAIKDLVGDYLYLYYYLKSKEAIIESKGTGTTFKAINSQELRSLIIAVPPLNEQKRIVEKIENINKYIDQLEKHMVLPK